MRRRHTARKHSRPAAPVTATVSATVARLGARGDGIARTDHGDRLYVAYTLPGETVVARPGPPKGDGRTATLVEVTAPSPARVPPPCPHFGTCGGCLLQHMAPPAEAAWKRDLVVEALGRRDLGDAVVAAPRQVPAGTRRRAALTWWKRGTKGVLGFNARASHRVVQIGPCPILHPDLEGLLDPLGDHLMPLLPDGQGDLWLCLTDQGVDLRLDLPAPPDLRQREGLAEAAAALDLARLTVRLDGLTEPLAIRRVPTITFGDVAVALPAGAFLQPSREGEAVLLGLVKAGLEGVDGPVADLFCGLGTFALPLAATHPVTAIDGDAAAVGALRSANRVRTMVRDLFKDPLAGKALAAFAAVVFDPPRAGAREQADALAADGPDRVVAVSCNPATFARDARILVDGGYDLVRVTPVDQFVWSAHVELVAEFRRGYHRTA